MIKRKSSHTRKTNFKKITIIKIFSIFEHLQIRNFFLKFLNYRIWFFYHDIIIWMRFFLLFRYFFHHEKCYVQSFNCDMNFVNVTIKTKMIKIEHTKFHFLFFLIICQKYLRLLNWDIWQWCNLSWNNKIINWKKLKLCKTKKMIYVVSVSLQMM